MKQIKDKDLVKLFMAHAHTMAITCDKVEKVGSYIGNHCFSSMYVCSWSSLKLPAATLFLRAVIWMRVNGGLDS